MKPEAGQNPTGSPALQLWLAFPGDLAEPAVDEACAALLDDAERARAARFRFDRHRREYLATHALTRVALSHAHPLPPHAWSFSVNQNGKPSPISWGGVPECGLRFNQSNSVELAVCLISRPAAQPGAAAPDAGVDVGVDVESFARAEEIVPLAARVFSAPIAPCRSGRSRRPTSRRAAWASRSPCSRFRSSSTVPTRTGLTRSDFKLPRASMTIPAVGDFAGSTMPGTVLRWPLKPLPQGNSRSSRPGPRSARQPAYR